MKPNHIMLLAALAALFATLPAQAAEPYVNPCSAKLDDGSGSSRTKGNLAKVCEQSNLMERCQELADKKKIPAVDRGEFMQRCANIPRPAVREKRGL